MRSADSPLYPVGGLGAQTSCPLAELVAAAPQGIFEDQAVLGLGAAAVGGGTFLQSEDEGFGDVSDQELRHDRMISHTTREKCRSAVC